MCILFEKNKLLFSEYVYLLCQDIYPVLDILKILDVNDPVQYFIIFLK